MPIVKGLQGKEICSVGEHAARPRDAIMQRQAEPPKGSISKHLFKGRKKLCALECI